MTQSNTIRGIAAAAAAVSLAIVPPSLRAQEPASSRNSGFNFIPGGTIAPPLMAADQEPRTGIRKEAGSSKLILDIGSTLDIAAYAPDDENAGTFGAGIDFFTYALSTSVAGRRLQIDAVDGFFGGHLAYRLTTASPDLAVRFRIIHRSAHFLDGHYDNSLQTWRDGQAPIPFTRDFGDLLVSAGWCIGDAHIALYSAVSYSTLIRPIEMKRISSVHGIELRSGPALGHALGKPLNLFAACNLSLDGVPAYVGTGTIEAGAKFGDWDGQGIRVVAGYRNGLEMFGQYYAARRAYWSLGLLFDIW